MYVCLRVRLFVRSAGGGRVAIQRSPSAIKQLLLEWVKRKVEGYEVCYQKSNAV